MVLTDQLELRTNPMGLLIDVIVLGLQIMTRGAR
jgi:hypothetical protein